SGAMARALSRIAHELIERSTALEDVVLVGIHTRGLPLAERLQGLVGERSGLELPVGALDITLHRDDASIRNGGEARPQVARATEVPVPLDGRTVVLVDDVLSTGRTIRAAIDTLLELGRPERIQVAVLVDRVLSTGRTIRAAIDTLLELGRPERIQVAVLVDRGHRELPIRPDYVGKNLPTARDERVQVQLVEVDGVDRVVLQREARGEPKAEHA
ncbi:MAG: bifunctional pyr operon transcriptional regulator/uracil phosphoribosyltransferase PyrR, partial [Actinobacteria bacterium]